MKTSELQGAALDWAVATANREYPQWDAEWSVFFAANGDDINYSTDWNKGGPIIEREEISIRFIPPEVCLPLWWAFKSKADDFNVEGRGNTPLIAAMRCYVASKLGDEVELPEELLLVNN